VVETTDGVHQPLTTANSLISLPTYSSKLDPDNIAPIEKEFPRANTATPSAFTVLGRGVPNADGMRQHHEQLLAMSNQGSGINGGARRVLEVRNFVKMVD